MDNNKIKVAAVQKAPVFLNKSSTVEMACDLIAEAGNNGASLAVFPEAFISGYPDWVWVVPAGRKPVINELYAKFLDNAVTIPDKTTELLCSAARKAGIFVAIGVNEVNRESSHSSVYNTILFIDSDGKILGKHRKLVPTGGERLMWAPGDGTTLNAFETSIGRLGGLICWENFMPLARMSMYQKGVQIYVAPTWDSSESWQIAMRHIAREGGMYVISCCQALKMDDIPASFEFKGFYPDGKEWINKGNSCVVNPKGEIIAGPLTEKQDVLYAEIDLSLISADKWMFDAAGHYNRPDVFDFKIFGQDH